MSQTAVQRFYRFHASVYDATRWLILYGRRRAIERLGLRPDSVALEIGCGTGLNFRHFLEHLDPRAGRLVGVDFSADMLRRAGKRVARRGWSDVELIQADASTLALPERFDAILFGYSLSMIPDWPAALRRAAEHLRPGGRLAILDFGTFAGWGPLGAVMRGWLRWNHVETRRPYAAVLREIFGDVEVLEWLGGYNFTAVCRRSGGGPGA